ncbi:MAG: ATP-dependent helicase HrpB [Verrucomicrobiaceae bacterium]|nr:ATP-dependent helicase HrpB [Verrucomicrobiaceae bacterium]
MSGDTGSRLVLEAPTGSGKSTQVPQMLLDNGVTGNGQVVVLQPRRIAARMLAKRVAGERGGRVGDEIGYQVRFDRVVSHNTRICYVTEGVLLRQLLDDPSLSGVGTIVFDEFHERHLQGDVTLAMAMSLQEAARPDLKIVVMSATLDCMELESHLKPCRLVRSSGRTFPVEVKYSKAGRLSGVDVWDGVASALREELKGKNLQGDVLVFMPGAYEIRRTIDAIKRVSELKGFALRPLYGQLPAKDQDAALMPGKSPKIVVATNVAETSLTIEGIKVVIDSGLARVSSFDARRGINTLRIEKISQSSADQRAGRAGRTSSGVCIRLWTERDHCARPVRIAPEVRRLDLSETLLALKAAGVEDVSGMRWLDAPESDSLQRANKLLMNLGAIESEHAGLTKIGHKMVAYPAHPRFSRMLVEAGERDCLRVAALCVALCQERELFAGRGGGAVSEFAGNGDTSDFMPLLRAWLFAHRSGFNSERCDAYGIKASVARDVGNVMKSLLGAGTGGGTDPEIIESDIVPEQLAKVVLAGFSDNVAKRMSEGTLSCNVVGGRRARIGRGSLSGGSEIVVASEMTEIEGKEVNVMLGKVTGVEVAWLRELFPLDMKEFSRCRYDILTRRVMNETGMRFRDLVLYSKSAGHPPLDQAADALAGEVVSGRLILKGWNGRCRSWIARVSCVRLHFPELGLPQFDDESFRLVVADACHGAVSYKQIKDRPVWPALRNWLSAEHSSAVEMLAPERIRLDNGLDIKVTYLDGEPKISIVLQKLYGVKQAPVVGGGEIPVLVEILGPNQRPVQRTSDMAGFWKNSYPEIRKQLKGRYPKHEWR